MTDTRSTSKEASVPQAGRLNPDQNRALGRLWSYLLYLWYAEPSISYCTHSPSMSGSNNTVGSSFTNLSNTSRLEGNNSLDDDGSGNFNYHDSRSPDASQHEPLSSLPSTISYYYHLHQLHANNASDEIATTISAIRHEVRTRLQPWPGAKNFSYKHSPAAYHDAFWTWVQNEHPDSVLIRNLKIRKWNPEEAMEVLLHALEWRIAYGLNDIALLDEDALDIRYPGFLYLLKRGKGFITGYDRQGFPMMYTNASMDGYKLHQSSNKLSCYITEHTRLMFKPPNDKFSVLLDLSTCQMYDIVHTLGLQEKENYHTHMDYHYNQHVTILAFYKAGWAFSGVWKIVSPLLVGLRQRVTFMSTRKDVEELFGSNMLEYMPAGKDGDKRFHSRSDLNKHNCDFEFPYVAPVPGENDLFYQESEAKQRAIVRRKELELAFESLTEKWLRQQDLALATDMIKERDILGYRLIDTFWIAEPYTRIRSIFHRLGKIRAPESFFSVGKEEEEERTSHDTTSRHSKEECSIASSIELLPDDAISLD